MFLLYSIISIHILSVFLMLPPLCFLEVQDSCGLSICHGMVCHPASILLPPVLLPAVRPLSYGSCYTILISAMLFFQFHHIVSDLLPVNDPLIIFFPRFKISICRVFYSLCNCFRDCRNCWKIHICNPHRDQVEAFLHWCKIYPACFHGRVDRNRIFSVSV